MSSEWIRYAGRIMVADNSIGVGHNGLVGGFRAVISDELDALDIGHVWVGPYSDAYGSHRSISGVLGADQTSALQTDCETYDPRIVIVGYAENDLGTSYTAAQTITFVTNCVNWVQAGAPQAIVIVRTAIVPQNATIPAYYARRDLFSEYNTLLPAMCSAEGVYLADIGAPTTSDGLHLDDTSTGYTSAGRTLAGVIVRRIP